MGKASITIAVNAKYNGKGIESAEKAMRRMSVLAAASSESVSSGWVKAGGKMAEVAGKMYNAGDKMAKMGDMLTKSVTVPMVAMGTYAAQAAINFDTALANVRKTSDLTEQQLQKLGDSALDLSTKQPVTAETILNIEALGAQLGVADDELESFAKTVSGLDIATNMDFETAGKEMAQFANITQMGQDKFQNYGSTIVDLGNHLATTEKDISAMALRLAGVSSAANFSQAEILGMSGAMSSLGIKAEAGGSAMTRIIQDISKNVANGTDKVQEYARVSGLSAEEFANKWKTKPMEAIELLVEGLGKSSKSGEDMNVTLEKLGINNVRNSDTMRRLAGAGDLLRESVERANTAWDQNSALQNEVDQRNESLASRLQVLKNKVDEIAITVGRQLVDAVIDALNACQPLIDGVANLADGFANMDESGQRTVLAFAGVVAAAGPVLSVTGRLVKGFSAPVDAIGKFIQSVGVYKDALSTTDGSQMRLYASSKLMSTSLGTVRNEAAKAAGGAENYIAAWEKMTDSAKVLGDFEGKFTKLSDEQVGASKKAADAIEQKKTALVKEAVAARESLQANGEQVKAWSGSSKEYNKAASSISKTTHALLDNEAQARGVAGSSKAASAGMKSIAENAKKAAYPTSSLSGAFKNVGSSVGGALSTVKNFAKATLGMIGPQLAITAAFAGISFVVGEAVKEYQEYQKRQELVNGAMQSAKDIAGNAAANVRDLGDAYSNLEVDNRLDDLKATNEDFAKSMNEIYTNSAKLNYSVGVIEELGNKSGLSAGEQLRLKKAVEDYNSITGNSVEITDAVNGKLSEGIGIIQANAETWKYNAQQQGYAAAAEKYYEQQAEAAANLAIAEEQLTDVQKRKSELEEEIIKKGSTTKRSKEMQELTDKEKELTQTIDDNKKAMDKAGESAEWLSEKSAEMATTVDAIKSVFDGWGDEVSAAFENSGVSADSFAAACAEAGISTETLHAVGSENFAKLMESCNGNVNQMIGVIQNWNGTPFLDKDGKVTVDDAKLVDAQGNVYTWNGTDFVDKDGNVLVDDQNLVDAQGNVYTWNGTILTDKDGKVVVDKGSLDQASSKVKSYNDQKIKDKKGSVKVDTSSIDNARNKWAGTHFATKFATIVTRNVLSSVREKATGGIRTHADGGMVRYHANGGSIVNVPGTGYPLDMVGEAGAEAIVPLTNKRYAMPFVKMIAGEIGKQSGGHTTINNYTLTIDGVRANGSQRAINLMEALFDEFNLTSEMGVC
jgi:TP901 family phage tail tape measure protein